MILVDAGPVIAAFDTADSRHVECAALLQEATDELLVPQPVVAEVCSMIGDGRAPRGFIRGTSFREPHAEDARPPTARAVSAGETCQQHGFGC